MLSIEGAHVRIIRAGWKTTEITMSRLARRSVTELTSCPFNIKMLEFSTDVDDMVRNRDRKRCLVEGLDTLAARDR